MLLDGRVAIVSGIGPGMGRDISLTLAREGADLVLGARTEATLRAVAGELAATGRQVVTVPTDITDAAACRRLADAAAELGGGRVDVLVDNAFAEEDWRTFTGFDLDRWRLPFEVNVFGTLQLTQAVVPHMKAGGGSIVVVNTMSTRIVNPVLGGYAASKAALMTATQVMAKELGKHRIRANCVAPGHIWGQSLATYFEWLGQQRGVDARDVYDEIAGLTALRHIPTSEEISRTVLFFASDLSGVVTGQTLDVNAGRYMH